MAELTAGSYRSELEWFRRDLTREGATRGQKRTLYGRGTAWYAVRAEPGLKLYFDLANLYLHAFMTPHGAFKFHGLPDPKALYGQIINATTLSFLESYNSSGGRKGLGLPQTDTVTVTLADLNAALSTLVSPGFGAKKEDDQRGAVARVVIGLVEGGRFKDVEDAVVDGTPIVDRNWPNHQNAAAVMIEAPA